MKRILHITECLGSGVLNYIKNISAWQVKDYEVYVAYAIRPETPENFREQFDKQVHFIEVKGFTREICIQKDWKAFCNIRKIVDEVNPDLIHLHSTKAGVLGRWAINTNKYKVLYSPHAYSFLMMDAGKWKRKIYKLLEKISDRKKCLTITDIDGELEASRAVSKNAICIPNGIDTQEMDWILQEAKKYVKPSHAFTICMSGKIVPQKNPALFNSIAKEFPDVQFVWIGEGTLRKSLDSPNIRVTGWLTRPQVLAEILSADVFVFTSVWESLSIALLEVMYAGKPCVVSTADGNRDVIKNGHNGFVCHTLLDYVNAIKQLKINDEMVAKYGRQAHLDIVEKYNVKVMEQNYRKLFVDLAGEVQNTENLRGG